MTSAEYYAAWRKANPEKVAAAQRRYRAKPESKAKSAASQRAYREKNRERILERDRRFKEVARLAEPGVLRDQFKAWRYQNPEKQMLQQARTRARRLGLPFNLTVEDIVIPKRCPLLGIRILLPRERGTGATGFLANSPSLDRIETSKGYVKGNVWVISGRANLIKRDATLDELEAIVRGLRKRLSPPRRSPDQPEQLALLPALRRK